MGVADQDWVGRNIARRGADRDERLKMAFQERSEDTASTGVAVQGPEDEGTAQDDCGSGAPEAQHALLQS